MFSKILLMKTRRTPFSIIAIGITLTVIISATVSCKKSADSDNNRWADGPYANQFLLPDNKTSTTDFK
jgi:hypothetical protein